ncbi:MAG: PLP-dependent aminotransferase family protein [Candidatus Dojkabacteria bacterium]|nr:PLP-dependent aminotransferase family protein [Candidatus Dojkabacteria bacterium]MDQ7021391.1 PLP-dependent aminotransferase family protein [Candidatus Dojkabacteria bacterium]
MNYIKKLSERNRLMDSKIVRDSLSTFGVDNLISLAAGHPAAESLDYELFKESVDKVLGKNDLSLMNYSFSNGIPQLREAVARFLKRTQNLEIDSRSVGISSGSQVTIDTVCKAFLDEGDVVLVEECTFLAALQSMQSCKAQIVPIPMDSEGIIISEYERLIEKYDVKLTYLIPTFQNPSGYTLSEQRRTALAKIIKYNDLIVLEDDPYGHINFNDKQINSIYSLAAENVIYLGTFSKSIGPGLRVGFYTGPFELIDQINAMRFSVDVHANVLAQNVVVEILDNERFYTNVKKMSSIYKVRKDIMVEALNKYLPESYSYAEPEGGMFIWLQGENDIDSDLIYKKAINNGVSFVPGTLFTPNKLDGKNKLRLNFSSPDLKSIDEGIKKLSEIL